MHVGLDLDNTLIDYSSAYSVVAEQVGLPDQEWTRRSVKAALIRQGDDELWQRFQSILYTEGLSVAKLAPGVVPFLQECEEQQISVSIISHKTPNSPKRFGYRDLRKPAVEWLERAGVLGDLVKPGNLHFCGSQEKKIEVIRTEDLNVFVDDLLDIVDHVNLPPNLLSIHYGNETQECGNHAHIGNFCELPSWLPRS